MTTEDAGDDSDVTPTAPYAQVVESDDYGGDTMAHYLSNEPRSPAPTGESLPLQRPDSQTTPEPLPPIQASEVDDEERPRSIAALFQDMLRSAFQAGTAAATTGESFEIWYQREVLQ